MRSRSPITSFPEGSCGASQHRHEPVPRSDERPAEVFHVRVLMRDGEWLVPEGQRPKVDLPVLRTRRVGRPRTRPIKEKRGSLKRLDITVESIQALLDEGLSYRQAAKRLHCDHSLISQRMLNAGIRKGGKSQRVLAEIIALRAQGKSWRAIGAAVGMSANSTLKAWKREQGKRS